MTALHSLVPHDSRRLKLAAIALLAVPAAVLALFAVAETVGGDVSGLQHVPEAAILVALAWLAWTRPRVAGIALAAGAVLFFVAWLIFVDVGARGWVGSAMTGIVIFLPPLVAAWLLLRAGRGSAE